ncbi:MAG: hypothetical protein M3T49_05590 [Candidatus Eremiobacteraeota bacterium]|nr:hypothetical protein [Candidatus Eremiobacteraeota bacterium]
MAQLLTPGYIAKVIDFILFVAFVVWLYRSYIQAALVAHQDAQNRAVAEAEEKRNRAEAAVVAARAALSKAQGDAQVMFAQAQERAENLVLEERAKARERAARVVGYARGELGREMRRVRRELLIDTVDLAHERARETVRASIDDEVQRRLISAFIGDLEHSSRA